MKINIHTRSIHHKYHFDTIIDSQNPKRRKAKCHTRFIAKVYILDILGQTFAPALQQSTVMTRLYYRLTLLPLTLLLACCAACAQQDWADNPDPLVVRALPDGEKPQPQNPPGFSWSQKSDSPNSYQIEIRSGDKVIKTFTAQSNWYLPAQAFEPGTYTWRVTPTEHTDWSKERTFVISAASALFEVPDNDTLRDRILHRARPRMLPSDVVPVTEWSDAMKRDRLPDLSRMMREVDLVAASEADIADKNWPLVKGEKIDVTYKDQYADVRRVIFIAEKQLEAAALLYRITGEKRFLSEAIKLGDQMSALNPEGPTSLVNQVQGTRSIALALIKGIDLLGVNLDQGRRTIWLASVAARGNQMYEDLTSRHNRIDQYPTDSMGGQTLAYLAVTSALALGEIPDAKKWFDFAFRDYINWVMAWSGPEGGFSNGTAYAQYTAYFALRLWPPIEYASGVNLFNKPWSTGFANYLIDFIPLGSKTHLFGDGHEDIPDFRVLKAFLSRFATSQSAWYVNGITAVEEPLSVLEAQYPLPVATVTATDPPPHAVLFDSIGWVAIHSDIEDLKRTSLYFKSSQFGAASHGQGDQNGIVLSKANVPLLIETGWYDWYDSPLFNAWYHQTASHNAITIDHGVGQITKGDEEAAHSLGRITGFSTSPEVDFAAGDATAAYGGQLSKALRKIWYLHDSDAIVIDDQLASPAPHIFEWNFHAVTPIKADAKGIATISNAGQSLCLTPILSDTSHYEKRSGPPPKTGTTEYHAAYVSNNAGTSQQFLTLLDVGCKGIQAQLSEDGRSLKVGERTINLEN